MSTHYHTATEISGAEIPDGFQRVSLARLEATGEMVYHVQNRDGTFYLCNINGENIGLAAKWSLLEPLADVPAGDTPALLEVIQGPNSSRELR